MQKAIQDKLDRLDEAFLFERSIDIETFHHHAEKLREELALARNRPSPSFRSLCGRLMMGLKVWSQPGFEPRRRGRRVHGSRRARHAAGHAARMVFGQRSQVAIAGLSIGLVLATRRRHPRPVEWSAAGTPTVLERGDGPPLAETAPKPAFCSDWLQ